MMPGVGTVAQAMKIALTAARATRTTVRTSIIWPTGRPRDRSARGRAPRVAARRAAWRSSTATILVTVIAMLAPLSTATAGPAGGLP